MTTPIPFDTFSAELSGGESIQWTGQPNRSVVFHPDDWLMIPFSLLWGGFAIFWLLAASGTWDVFSTKPSRDLGWFGIIWGTPFVIVGQYMIWGRFFYESWKKKRTFYALTDRRVLLVEQGLMRRSSTSVYFSNLNMVDKRVRGDGIGDIAFNGAVVNRWRSGRNNPPPPPTFRDIDNAESVFRLIEDLRTQARQPSRF
jgi:hypothetical protein